MGNSTPAVTVILPTYNRADMLSEVLEALASQTFSNWHLVCVDDGSTDRNKEVVEQFASRMKQPVEYIYQQNQGPGAARRTALTRVRGDYVAFMDSDDPWLDYHLEECVDVLNSYAEIDWVVTPSRVVDLRNGQTVKENDFYKPDGNMLDAFDAFHIDKHDNGRICIPEPKALAAYIIARGELSGLQGALLRRWVVEKVAIRPYRLFDDVAYQIEMIGAGAKQAYLPLRPHVCYRVHAENTSLVNDPQRRNYDKRLSAYRDGVNVFRDLLTSPFFTPEQLQILRHRLAYMLVWDLGYNTYLQNGNRREARQSILAGLKLNPLAWRSWKALLRTFV